MTTHLPSPPPEWASQDQLLIGWPSHFDPWGQPFTEAQKQIAAFANHVIAAAEGFSGKATEVVLVLEGDKAEVKARAMVPGAKIINIPCGDTWVRDTAPVFSRVKGQLYARSFRFNGWGEKYIYPGDAELSVAIAERLKARRIDQNFVLEGGSVDWDDTGCLLTTDDCVLNPNRNGNWSRDEAETALKNALGMQHIIWIKDGLLNDHTDGHVDNIARFVGSKHVICQSAQSDDSHAERLRAIEETLRNWRSPEGEALTVTTIPSPGRVLDEDGDFVPASHANFAVTNQAVIVPAYNQFAEDAVAALQPLFPGRKVVASPADAVLTGGGSFHCISQQIPSDDTE